MALSELDGGPSIAKPSLWYYFKDVTEHDPESLALIVEHQPQSRLSELLGLGSNQGDSDDGLTCTYKQLMTACLRLSSGLIKQGVKPGDCIAAFIPSGLEWILLYWTSIMMKTTLSLLDPESLLPARNAQLKASLQVTKPRVILVDNADQAAAIDHATSGLGLEPHLGIALQTASNSSNGKWYSLADITTLGGANPVDETKFLEDALHDDADRNAWIFFTSGTSAGNPKAVPRTVGSIAHATASYPKLPSTNFHGRTQRWSISTTNYRVAAATALINMYRTGYTMVIAATNFDAGAVLEAIERRQVDGVMLLPNNLYQLMHHPDYSPDSVKSVAALGIAGDVITQKHLQLMKRLFPTYMVTIVVYAMTEGAGWVAYPFVPITPIDKIPYLDGVVPAGRVQHGTRVRIVDPDTMSIIPRGETGELLVHSDSVIKGYLGDNGQAYTDAAFHIDADGLRWYRTADRAIMADDGLI